MSFDWDEHYKRGGVSGDPADYTKGRAWKMGIIKKPKHLSVFKTLYCLLTG